MANIFLPGDAKKLVEYHRTLLHAADEVRSQKNAHGERILQLARRLAGEGYFDRRAEAELAAREELQADAQLKQLLGALSAYLNYSQNTSACERMQEDVIPDVQHAITQIAPLLRGLKWMFAPAEKKEAALAALDYLRGLLNTSYPDAVCDAAEVGNIAPLQGEELLADFDTRRVAYCRALEELAPECMDEPSDTAAYAGLLAEAKTTLGLLSQAQSEANLCRSQVAGTAGAVLKNSVLHTMRSIPVEELKNAREGVRIKSLRDSGYENMADIHTATHYQLAAVNGISEEGADDLKRYAATMAQALAKRTALRLNADDRSQEFDHLLQALYSYIQRMEPMRQLKELQAEQPALREAYDCLNPFAAPARSIFLTPLEKQAAYDAYPYLQGLAATDYAPRAAQAAEEMLRPCPCTRQQAREAFQQDPIGFANALEQAVPGLAGNGDGLYGLPEELALQLQDMRTDLQGLKYTLRSYQELGVKYILHQKKVLLGDEMGLGKTVQAIAAMVALRNAGEKHFLVICPASVITNWCREVSSMSDLDVIPVHGAGRELAVSRWKQNGGTAITTYETCSALQLEEEMRIAMLVVDEAHYIKNRQTRRSFYVRELAAHAEWVLFMTGTALENRAEEMVSLVEGLQPEIAERIHHMTYMVSAPQFRKEIAPVYYRRKREDVLTELPELMEIEAWCDPGEEERQRYEVAVIDGDYMETRRISWNVRRSSPARPSA